ncbi:hypothetical protein ILYODFUR_031190 [Ilyodon furcidens]|uniref:Uncharacterized protein n=1 Tax=Ilyodon furcidens TaxID=33524 RepID=A0ABV0T4F6_9TELE
MVNFTVLHQQEATSRPQPCPAWISVCACEGGQSLVLEVVFQGLGQWKRLDVMDAFPTQSEPSYSPAQIHEGEGLRCEGENKRHIVRVQTELQQASTPGSSLVPPKP